MMLGGADSIETVARVIQTALTPVFLLSGIGSLLGVCSTRLARVADRLDALVEKVEVAPSAERARLQSRVIFLRRRSHALDLSVILGAIAGGATCFAALLLFVGSLADRTIVSILVLSFGLALICTIGALAAFLAEMLMASRGIRDQADRAAPAEEAPEACDMPEPQQADGIAS